MNNLYNSEVMAREKEEKVAMIQGPDLIKMHTYM